MFIYHKSNSLSQHILPLSEALFEYRKNDPFKKTWIVVQNKEAQQWLILELSRITGISFNIEFVLPSEVIWKLYRLFEPELPSVLPSDRMPILWKVFEMLENDTFKDFPYYRANNQQTNLQLASQIADVFDLYQIYRPKLIRAWEEGKYLTEDSSERWQARLWNYLSKVWNKEFPDIPTRADVFFELKDFLKKETNHVDIPSAIFVFGHSHLSTPFLEILETISLNSDVHLFRNNYPISEDIQEQTAILNKDWAKPSLNATNHIEEILSRLGTANSREIAHQTPSKNVLSGLDPTNTSLPIAIHSCHNERREAEIVKDELLSHLNSDLELSVEDVLILVPDIYRYGGIIESVFTGYDSEPSIPIYNPASRVNRVVDDFLFLLGLLDSEFKVSDISELLTRNSIQERFNLSEEEVYIIESWLSDNKIHWGLTSEDSVYSLSKASSNFLSGFLIEGNEFQSLESHIPYKNIDSTDRGELAAHFTFLVRFLEKWNRSTSSQKSLLEWVKSIIELCTSLTPATPKNEYDWISVLQSINQLEEIAAMSNSSVPLDFGLFKQWFNGYMSNRQASSTRIGRGVMLSTYIPYRGIPFKRIYMLGMNEKEFPRNSIRPSFDLINKYPETGDRISKEDDVFLFYELLHNTTDFLSISYIGQDMYSNKDKLPSVLVQKLIDLYPGIKVKKHKLHGFDPGYFSPASSFSTNQKDLSEKIASENTDKVFFVDDYDFNADDEKPIIGINQVIGFFSHSSKYMLSNVFQIKNPFENKEPEDRETFKISGLSKYEIDHFLVEALANGYDEQTIEKYVSISGLIPEGPTGRKDFKHEVEEVLRLLELSKPYQNGEESTINVAFSASNFELQDEIQVIGDTQLFIKPSRLKARDFINAWIKHLALQTSSRGIKTILIGRNEYNTGIDGYCFSEIDEASNLLNEIAEKFLKAFSSKKEQNFFPNTSKKYFENQPLGTEKAFSAAWKAWEGSEYVSGEGTDFYTSLNWRGENPIADPAFKANAEFFWAPLLENLEKLKL